MGLFEFLQMVVGVLERLGIPYLVTDSVAAMAFGEPRLTNDIDIVAAIDETLVKDLVMSFPPDEFYVSQGSDERARLDRLKFRI